MLLTAMEDSSVTGIVQETSDVGRLIKPWLHSDHQGQTQNFLGANLQGQILLSDRLHNTKAVCLAENCLYNASSSRADLSNDLLRPIPEHLAINAITHPRRGVQLAVCIWQLSEARIRCGVYVAARLSSNLSMLPCAQTVRVSYTIPWKKETVVIV